MLILPVILSICQQLDDFRHHFLFFDRKKLVIISRLHKEVPQKFQQDVLLQSVLALRFLSVKQIRIISITVHIA